ncbi:MULTISPECIES: Bug family tripartite tricarboxylate transporter substrate binding protein [Bordetella]|uniref:Transcriptional initiation protein Tat n=1 Tax=Bordetella genomosp. 2 TaxID=1983456 RepID=A0A261VS50_9BORD|nr:MULTISPECIES: tripartite tricarboxylate transporter substrate binding protein [Bordetella]OZI76420.1 transcriptional initiation protein Tat [Bordetella genomosp. 2]
MSTQYDRHTAAAGFSSRRRRLLAGGMAAGSALLLPGLGAGRAQAQGAAYPGSKPIELVVPGGPGAGTDVVARVAAKGLAEHLAHNVVVKNMPGAAGIIGAQAVARADPDGHTLLFAITGTHTVNQFLYPDLPYNPEKDFAPVSLVCKYNNVLVVRPDFEAQTFQDLIALVRANPGKYFYGITANGSSSHLATELLKSEAKLTMPGVPYRSASAAVGDFLGGQFPVLMDTVINQLPHIRAGKVVALATTGAERSPVLPDVPTIAESGFPGIVAIGWGGIMAPAGTSPAAVQALNQAVRQTLASPAFDSLKLGGLETQYTTPDEMAAFIAQESAKWGRLVKAGNIKPS